MARIRSEGEGEMRAGQNSHWRGAIPMAGGEHLTSSERAPGEGGSDCELTASGLDDRGWMRTAMSCKAMATVSVR